MQKMIGARTWCQFRAAVGTELWSAAAAASVSNRGSRSSRNTGWRLPLCALSLMVKIECSPRVGIYLRLPSWRQAAAVCWRSSRHLIRVTLIACVLIACVLVSVPRSVGGAADSAVTIEVEASRFLNLVHELLHCCLFVKPVSGVLFDASMRESAEFGEIRDALVREVSALGSRALVMQYKISLLIGDNRSRCDGTIQQATMPEHTIINKTCTKDESAATQFGHLVLMKLS